MFSSQKKKSTGDYTIQFSKAPNGISLGTAAKKCYFDPATLANDSNVRDWVNLFQKKLISKFNSINDAFRHFDICQTGKIDYKQFCFILDTLTIRFSQPQLREMFNYIDSDFDGLLTYQDF